MPGSRHLHDGISIIMPTYNRGDILPRAIGSVLEQSHCEIELIIIDDGSADDTEQVVRSFQDPRIKFFQSDHKGASAARNIGLERAEYDYIAFLDSDDQWHPDFLSTLLEHLVNAEPDVGVVFCGYWYFSESGKTYRPQPCPFKKGDITNELIKGNFVALPAAVVKKECISMCGGFDEALPCRHDWELWIRIAQQWKFLYIEKPLLNVYKTQNSIGLNYRFMIEGWAPLIKKHVDVFRRYPDVLASHYLKIAKSLWYPVDRDEFSLLKHYTLKGFLLSPKQIKGYLQLLLASVLGYRLYSCYRRMKLRRKKNA